MLMSWQAQNHSTCYLASTIVQASKTCLDQFPWWMLAWVCCTSVREDIKPWDKARCTCKAWDWVENHSNQHFAWVPETACENGKMKWPAASWSTLWDWVHHLALATTLCSLAQETRAVKLLFEYHLIAYVQCMQRGFLTNSHWLCNRATGTTSFGWLVYGPCGTS